MGWGLDGGGGRRTNDFLSKICQSPLESAIVTLKRNAILY